MKRLVSLLLCLCLLTGCSLVPAAYYQEKLHTPAQQTELPEAVEVRDLEEMTQAILRYVKAGAQTGSIRTVNYNGNVEDDVLTAVYNASRLDPVGAYAVDLINHTLARIVNYYEISLNITYRRTAQEIAAIQPAYTPQQLRGQVERALLAGDDHLALQVTEDQTYDLEAIVDAYCRSNPTAVVELPTLSSTIWPESGRERIVELNFTYTKAASVREQMQTALTESVDAAAEYIRYRSSDWDKTQLLFTYLTERFVYVPGQSVTPAYSALCEGIADPRGLAMGLTLICQKAGVECWTVSGLRDGEPYFWNIIGDDGDYRHVDLAQSLQNGSLRRMTDWEMNRYYWATAEYPACVAEAPVQEETEETS